MIFNLYGVHTVTLGFCLGELAQFLSSEILCNILQTKYYCLCF